MHPIEQFEISNLKLLGDWGAYHFAFTNSAAYMLLCLALIAGITLLAMRGDNLVPGRLQSAVEAIYEFMADTVRQSAGEEGMKFFPFVFSLFAFVLVCIGIIALRKSDPDAPRPFRTPGMPWVPIIGALACIAQMLSLPLATWIRLVVWLLLGFVMYFGYARRRSRF